MIHQQKLIQTIVDEFIPNFKRATLFSPSAGDHPSKFQLREIDNESPKLKKIIEDFKLIGAKRPLGMLLYVALGSRPDIAWIVNTLARYVTTDYGIDFIKAIPKVIKYLKSMINLCLRIGGTYTDENGKLIDSI